MKPEEKIYKAIHTAFEAAKDKAQTDVYNAVINKNVKLDKNDVQKVMAIVAAAIDSVYSGSNKSIRNSITTALSDTVEATKLETNKEAPKRTASKSVAK